jgi:hypothetical protein
MPVLALLAVASCAVSDPKSRTLNTKSGPTSPAVAQASPPVDVLAVDREPEKSTPTRVYDVRDLLAEVTDPVNVAELGKPKLLTDHTDAQPQATPATRPSAERVRKLIDLITEAVDPDSWGDTDGGSAGTIRELEGQLIVTQTKPNHQQIVDLLEKLRESRGPQITVEGRYIWLDPSTLPANLRDKLRSRTRGGEQSLKHDEVTTLVKHAAPDRDTAMMTMPRVTLFNRRRGCVMTSSETQFVSGFKPAKPGAKPEPELSSVMTGSLFDVAATLTGDRDRKYVQLKLRPRLVKLERLEPQPFQGPPGTPEGLMVQVPMMSCRSVDTTLIVPDGRTAVVAGLMGPDGAGDGAKEEWSFLLVKPTIRARNTQ